MHSGHRRLVNQSAGVTMLWRVRTTLPDRPGSLAVLARNCGGQRVNILGLQIFPTVDGVTDELVLRTPAGWRLAEIAQLVEDNFDLRPGAFRHYLDLHRPIYQKTAAYGHFGREDHDFTWEATDKAAILADDAGVIAAARA